MAKKRFSKGLDGVFTDAWEEEIDKDPFLGADVVVKEQGESHRNEKPTRSQGKKSFTSDLDSLLENEMSDLETRKASGKEKQQKPNRAKRRYRKPLRGLNALIRQTLEPDFYEIEDDKKRVTFIYKKSKYKKLKKIAQREDQYLKDIIGQVLNKYIKMYEEQLGKLN